MSLQQSKLAAAALTARSNEETCLAIVNFCSPFTATQIAARMTTKLTLGDLGISASMCDRGVRALINKKIRIPSGATPLPRGAIRPDKTVVKLIAENA